MSKTLKVLIADDSAVFRERLRTLITELPQVALVGEATNGQEALEQARALRPDVLILDVRMPRMSGLAVLKELRQAKSRTTVIVLTIQSESVYRERVLGAGANYFLNKATQINELESLLLELVKRHAR